MVCGNKVFKSGLSGLLSVSVTYLIWAAPEYPVFLDGRTDVFEWTGILSEFGNWATLRSDPRILLEKYGISFCLLNRESPMVRVLPLLPGWKIVYSDSNAVVLARTPVQGAGGGTQADASVSLSPPRSQANILTPAHN